MMPILNHRRLRRPCLLVCCLAMFGLSACEQQNHLEGRLLTEFNLDFDRVSAYWLNQDLIIAFEKKNGSARLGKNLYNQAARLVLLSERKQLAAGEEIPYEAGEHPCSLLVEHYVVHENKLGQISQESNFPPFSEMQIRFEELGRKPGESLVGNFHCGFSANMDLWGEFETILRDP